MKSRKVISDACLPVRLPIYPTVTVLLLLDRFHAPGWLWGVMCTLYGALLVAGACLKWSEKPADIFKQEDGDHG